MAIIINGKAIALQMKKELSARVEALKGRGIRPKLSVILIGGDPASQVYVRNKEKGCSDIGIISETHILPETALKSEIIDLIRRLNSDKSVHGILLQLPLPRGLHEKEILHNISPEKDVDGLHYDNMGKLFKGENALFLPCTPSGVMHLLLSTGISIEGKEAVVVGRSNIVGKPISILLLNANATVTICHSKTTGLAEVVRRADILIAAVGKPKLITGDMVKRGAVVIDVGMNRLESGLVGDVDFDSVKDIASYITPVPGGVGPMTIAMLLKNTVISAERS